MVFDPIYIKTYLRFTGFFAFSPPHNASYGRKRVRYLGSSTIVNGK